MHGFDLFQMEYLFCLIRIECLYINICIKITCFQPYTWSCGSSFYSYITKFYFPLPCMIYFYIEYVFGFCWYFKYHISDWLLYIMICFFYWLLYIMICFLNAASIHISMHIYIYILIFCPPYIHICVSFQFS